MTISEYIADAMKNGKTVTIKYIKNSGEISERKISEIEPSDEFGEGYIYAYCHLREEYRTFKISRIREVDGIKAVNENKAPKSIYTFKSPYTPNNTPVHRPSSVSTSTYSSDRALSGYQSANSSSNHSIESSYKPAPQKNEGCYIATMAYGDYNHPSVMVLRKFRDEKLQSNYLGSVCVSFYYWFSPKLVKFLSGHEKTNSLIRVALDKIVLHLNNK